MTYNPNYPVSADVLANPTSLTNRDDAGFELHGVISRIQDILEALEAKLGIGASAPGATAAVLRRTAAGASAWAQAQPGDLAAGGTANRLLGTTDGVNVGMTTVNGSMVPATALNVSSLFAGGTGNRVLRNTDGTNPIWGQVITADIANNAITAALLGAGAVGQIIGAAATSQTYGGATPAQIPGTLINWTSLNKPILVIATLRDLTATASTGLVVNVFDGAAPTLFLMNEVVAAGSQRTLTAIAYLAAPGAGAHAYSLYWSMSAPQVTATATSLAIVELH